MNFQVKWPMSLQVHSTGVRVGHQPVVAELGQSRICEVVSERCWPPEVSHAGRAKPFENMDVCPCRNYFGKFCLK